MKKGYLFEREQGRAYGRVGRNAFGGRLGNHTQSCRSGTWKVAVKMSPGVQGE